MGAFFEVMLVIGLIGTAVALYPIVKRQNDRVALGYVRGGLPEAAVIVVGTLLVPTLARSSPLASRSWRSTIGRSFGHGLVLGANTLLLAYLASIHQLSRPVPHRGPPRTEEHGSSGSVRDTDPLA
jgi:hypothetical protein